MSTNPYTAAYLESKLLSASPVDLIYLAYTGTIEAISNARAHIRAKEIVERSRAITKAQLIIQELNRALDFEKGGDISLQLSRLYDYMQKRLLEANFRQLEEPLVEAQSLLETLAEAWKELSLTENAVLTSAATASRMSGTDAIAYSRAEYTF
jgi:flagellar secretion chaperone FliS